MYISTFNKNINIKYENNLGVSAILKLVSINSNSTCFLLGNVKEQGFKAVILLKQ